MKYYMKIVSPETYVVVITLLFNPRLRKVSFLTPLPKVGGYHLLLWYFYKASTSYNFGTRG